MKKIIVMTMVMLAFTNATAAMKEHSYLQKVEGIKNCQMPADMHSPGIGECRITVGTVKTGTEIVRRNGKCIKVEREMTGIEVQPTANGHWVEVPQIHSTMTSVECK